MDLQGWAGGHVSVVSWWILWAWGEQLRNCLTLKQREELSSWQRKPHEPKSLFSHDCLIADCSWSPPLKSLLGFGSLIVQQLMDAEENRVLNMKLFFICFLILACFCPPVFSTNCTYWWKPPKQEDSPAGKTRILNFPPFLLSEVFYRNFHFWLSDALSCRKADWVFFIKCHFWKYFSCFPKIYLFFSTAEIYCMF